MRSGFTAAEDNVPPPTPAAAPREMDASREAEIVRRARNGCMRSFEILLRYYQPRLLRYLAVRGIPRAEAEDVVQTTFISAWKYLHSYRDSWRFSTWLFTIARRGLNTTRLEVSAEDLENQTHASPDAFEQQLRDSVWARAREALDRPAFDALWLHHGEGFTGREIARILDRSPVWVRVSLHRSRTTLKKLLNTESTT